LPTRWHVVDNPHGHHPVLHNDGGNLLLVAPPLYLRGRRPLRDAGGSASYFDRTAIGWQTIFTYFLLFFFEVREGDAGRLGNPTREPVA
jgi:hypothetical protein